MPRSLNTLIQICLFKAKPQDLEASLKLLITAIIASFVVFIIRNSQLIGNDVLLSLSVAQIILLGAALWLLLMVFAKRERWLQSATALYGCSALILIVVIPVMVMTGSDIYLPGSITLPKIIIFLASLWYFIVIIFIFRETLEIKNVFAFVIALIVELMFATILISLFGEKIL